MLFSIRAIRYYVDVNLSLVCGVGWRSYYLRSYSSIVNKNSGIYNLELIFDYDYLGLLTQLSHMTSLSLFVVYL